MKRLLFLINTLDGGGAEKVLIDMVNALAGDGFDITLMTITDRGVYKNAIGTGVKYKSIVKLKNSFMARVFTYLVNFIIPPWITHRLFIGNQYDYETAFLEGVPTKLIAASGNKSSKKFAWVHIDLYNTTGQIKAFKSDSYQVACYKRFDKIICVSQAAKKMFCKRFGISDNIEVKYNAINDADIKNKASENKKCSGRILIVSVGRLEKQKGYDRLLRIAYKLKADGHDFEVIIVGEGSERMSLEAYIKQHDMSQYLSLAGFKSNPYKYMQSADFLVFPSRAEGLSTVVTEAIILGKPVIATDCSGMREILGNSEYGIVTENDDDRLYDAVKKMLTDSSLRSNYEAMAKKRSKQFKFENRIKEIEKLFGGKGYEGSSA